MTEMTNGEYRVGIDFNPSNDDMVARIKAKAAWLIDTIEEIEACFVVAEHGAQITVQLGEVRRLKALAKTAIEEGAMWAVKAATKRTPS